MLIDEDGDEWIWQERGNKMCKEVIKGWEMPNYPPNQTPNQTKQNTKPNTRHQTPNQTKQNTRHQTKPNKTPTGNDGGGAIADNDDDQ